MKNRVVVEHLGNDDGDGEWKCHKDSKALGCVHIVGARHTLQKYLHGDANATDPNAPDGSHQGSTYLIVFHISTRLNRNFRWHASHKARSSSQQVNQLPASSSPRLGSDSGQ